MMVRDRAVVRLIDLRSESKQTANRSQIHQFPVVAHNRFKQYHCINIPYF